MSYQAVRTSVTALGEKVSDSCLFPLVAELREAHRAGEQKLHERLFAALERGDQLVGEGDRLVPRAEDRRDFALLREGRKGYFEAC